jgi:small subunit ribosomal protein S16
VAVKIRLKRMGKIRAPFYRVVVMDSRTKRDGRAIEEIGKYHPTAEPSVIEIDSDRAQHWLSTGAQPTEAVAALLKVTGDWQRFKGLPGAEGTLKVAEAKKGKKELYEAAIAAAGGSSLDVKDTPTRKSSPAKSAAKKAAEKPAEKAAETKPAETAPETTAEPAPAAADTDSGVASVDSTDADADSSATSATDTASDTDTAVETPADGGYGAGSAAPNADGSGPEGFPVKGNKDSMKFHEPDGQWYDQTVAEVWFADADAAEKAGFAKAGS